MWELTIMLGEDAEIYFCYKFPSLASLMLFLATNEEFNSDRCIYSIEKIIEED